jgi:hypothetical protein
MLNSKDESLSDNWALRHSGVRGYGGMFLGILNLGVVWR